MLMNSIIYFIDKSSTSKRVDILANYYCYDALHFHTWWLKSNIFKVLFQNGRGSQKRVHCVYSFDNGDNSG